MDTKILAIAGIVAVVVVAAAAVLIMNPGGSDEITEGVIYDGNGGTTSDGKTTQGVSAHEVMVNLFTKDGACFESWNTEKDGSGRMYSPGDTISYGSGKTVRLYAIWDEGKHLHVGSSAEHFSLTYEGKTLNSLSLVSLPASGTIHLTLVSDIDGAQAVLSDNKADYRVIDGSKVHSYTISFTATGATGFALVPSNGGDVLIEITFDGSQDVELTFLEGSMTWSKGIHYSGNGGKTSSGESSAAVDSTTVSANMFTLEGKTFVGWNTSKDGSGTSYKAGDPIDYYGYALLYAQWA